MAILKLNEIKQMNEKALEDKLNELRNELISINAQVAMGTLPENPGKIKEIKRTVAKILTIKKLKEGEDKV